MPTVYVQRSDTSDLSGGGEYSRQLLTTTAAVSDLVIALAASQTKTGHSFTEAGIPGADGVTGDYTVEVDIAVGDSNVMISVAVGRVNSAGTLQTESSFTAEQVAAGAVLTFNLTSVDLGTWAAGDRLRVAVRYRNSHTHTGRNVTVSFNTNESEVIAPWSSGTPATVTPATIAVTAAVPTPTPSIPATVTPATIGGASTPGYVDLPGASTDHVTTPDANDLDITGDLEIIGYFDIDNRASTNGQNLVTKGDPGNTAGAYRWRITNTGILQLTVRESGGTNRNYGNSTQITETGPRWLRVTLDVDNGAGSSVARMYESTDPADTVPGSVSWSQLGGDITIAATYTINPGTAAQSIGNRADEPNEALLGAASVVHIIDGVTLVADPDFRTGDQTSDGGATFTDSFGHVWTVNGNAAWVADVAGALGFTVPTPTIDVSSGTTVTPATVPATTTVPQPGVAAAATVEPATVVRVVTVPASVVSAGAAQTPAVIPAAFTTLTATITAAALVAPTVTARSFTIPQATPAGGGAATVSPATIVRVFGVAAATVSVPGSVTPTVVARLFAIPQATVTGGAAGTATPAVITTAVLLPAASVAAGAFVLPGLMSRLFTLPQATVAGGGAGVATPATIVQTVTLPALSVLAASNVTPGVISRSVVIPAVSVSGGATGTASPSVIVTSIAVAQATPVGNTNVFPSVIVVGLGIPGVSIAAAVVVTSATVPLVVVMPVVFASEGERRRRTEAHQVLSGALEGYATTGARLEGSSV